MDEGSKINPADIRDLIGKDWSPERWRFGVGVRGCEIPDEKKYRGEPTRRSRENFLARHLSAPGVCVAGYAVRLTVRNGAVISSNHGWSWMDSANFLMRK